MTKTTLRVQIVTSGAGGSAVGTAEVAVPAYTDGFLRSIYVNPTGVGTATFTVKQIRGSAAAETLFVGSAVTSAALYPILLQAYGANGAESGYTIPQVNQALSVSVNDANAGTFVIDFDLI